MPKFSETVTKLSDLVGPVGRGEAVGFSRADSDHVDEVERETLRRPIETASDARAVLAIAKDWAGADLDRDMTAAAQAAFKRLDAWLSSVGGELPEGFAAYYRCDALADAGTGHMTP